MSLQLAMCDNSISIFLSKCSFIFKVLSLSSFFHKFLFSLVTYKHLGSILNEEYKSKLKQVVRSRCQLLWVH